MITTDVEKEGNKLIANFITIKKQAGWLYFNHPLIDQCAEDWNNYEFHESYEWLMPVVKKCKRVNALAYKGSNIESALLSLNVEKLWKAVVEFVVWYNKNKK